MAEDKAQWQETSGFAADTAIVQVIVKDDDKQEWFDEADENGYNSASKYLYELIQEARAYREEGFLSHHQNQEQIEELEAQVAALEERLAEEEQRQSGEVMVDDPAFVKQFLTTNYHPLKDILSDIVESGALDGLLRKRVEDQLYFLASQNQVEYERGWGWKLTPGGDD